MKARVPKLYQDLDKKQQEVIKEYIAELATDMARQQEEKDCRLILDLYMKMVCYVLHDAFGFGEKRLVRFLGNHKRMFNFQNRLVMKGEQLEYLNKRMDEIFKKDGFPQEFFDSLLGEVEIIDAPEERGGQNG